MLRSVGLIVVLVVTVVAFGAAAGRLGHAREATPATGDGDAVTIETLGSGLPMAAPGQMLSLVRVTIAPGGVIPPHTQPGAVVLAVESGTFGFTLTRGSGQLTRAAAGPEAGVSGTPTTEALAVGTEVILQAGDSVFQDREGWHTGRNAGEEPVILLLATLYAADEPVLMFEEGTPPATTPSGETQAVEPVTVRSVDVAFVPAQVEIPAGQDVTINLPNDGGLPHNFSIDELGISVDITAGETASVVINAPAGEYQYYCDIPGHKEAGMVGTLVVR